jgi:hypothetical protein
MENQININLGDVQKTLFLPLWGRAVEAKKEGLCWLTKPQ